MREPDRPQMTIWSLLFAFWINKATDTLRLCNTDCLSTATLVIGTRRTVSLDVLFQSSYIYYYCGMSVLFLVESSPCSLLSGIVSQILPSRICHCSFGHQNFTLKQDREYNRLAKNSHIIIKKSLRYVFNKLKTINSLSLFFCLTLPFQETTYNISKRTSELKYLRKVSSVENIRYKKLSLSEMMHMGKTIISRSDEKQCYEITKNISFSIKYCSVNN